MNAQTRDEHAERIYELVRKRARRKKHRVADLSEHDRNIVINAAVWRLVQDDYIFGNVRDCVVGSFWQENSKARNRRINTALNTAYRAHIRSLKSASAAPDALPEDPTSIEDLARFVDGCTPSEVGPGLRELPDNDILSTFEQEKLNEEREAFDTAIDVDRAAAVERRAKIESEENEKLRLARNAYAETLEYPRHKRALALLCAYPTETNKNIAAWAGKKDAIGVSEKKVAKIREHMTKLADEILTPSPEDPFIEELERLHEVIEAERELQRAKRRLELAKRLAALPTDERVSFMDVIRMTCSEEYASGLDALIITSIVPKEDDAPPSAE